MSEIKPSPGRLEDGEIDEGESVGEPSAVQPPSTSGNICSSFFNLKADVYAESNIKNKKHKDVEISPRMATLGKAASKEQTKRTKTRMSSFHRGHQNENSSDFIGEDEMLCVRGASPVPFIPNLKRRSSLYDSDSLTMDIKPPKRKKTSGKKRHRKRTSPKRVSRERKTSSDDHSDHSPKETSPPPLEQKLHQLCKFYLQDCCAKGANCEYMHSEFPCKFFHMGLKCEDELANGKCKLSHSRKLSSDLLVALIRHIHTAPHTVLGSKFVELRSKMAVGQLSKMLYEKLIPEDKSEPSTSVIAENTSAAELKNKLYFLSEKQISKLQELRVTKVEDLLNLTLAQLNNIGIRASQIEAVQMSSKAGEDMDMRIMLPSSMTKPVDAILDTTDADFRKEVDRTEENAGHNWCEEEEQPLIIDESDEHDSNWHELDQLDKDLSGSSSLSYFCIPCDEGKNDDNRNSPIKDVKLDEDESKHSPEKAIAESSNDTAPGVEETSSKPLEDDGAQITWVLNSIQFNSSAANQIKEQEKLSNLELAIVSTRDGLKMQNSSSEDWDSLDRDDGPSYSKEIVGINSPDISEDETTASFTSDFCPQLPLRTPNLDNYTPAIEIDAHLTYPAMEYKLYEVHLPDCDVNRPPLMDKLLKSNSIDPRLKKFVEKEKNLGILPQADYSFFPPTTSHYDPRLRPGYGNVTPEKRHYNASPILYRYLQRSLWYQQLKSNLKIQINHSISDLVRALNEFHKDTSPQKIFDIFKIECAGMLLEVMQNVGIFVDVNGNITEESNYEQLCAPQHVPYTNTHSCSNNPAGVSPMKPGLLGFAPPGIRPPMLLPNNDNRFRQAIGCNFQNNKSNENYRSDCGFCPADRSFNRDRGSPESFQKFPNRNFKRRL